MNNTLQWWVDVTSILTFIITTIGAAVGIFGYLRYRYEFHQKSERLEKYLRLARDEDKKKDKLGQRSVLQIIRDVGLTEEEIIKISFDNARVARRVSVDPETNLANKLLFQYKEKE